MVHSRVRSHGIFALTTTVVLFVILGFALWSYLNYLLSPINPSNANLVTFVVDRGDNVAHVGAGLTQSGLIRSSLAFRLAVYLEKVGDKLQAGEYQLAKNQSVRSISNALTRGIATDNILTIPEGYRLEQIGETVESKLAIKYSDFILASKGQEGYLFPDTYAFGKETTAQEIITKLRSTWDSKVATLSRTPTYDEVILASILERETLTNTEKPIVAGILKKRLAEGWALEVDATIQYMLGKKGGWWPIPLLGDRKLKSAFNTYLNQGIPPSPICNPGLVSLAAIISPEQSPYYFYLHDKQGNIHYAATNAEHESNIAKYIR
ncbi:MAG: endolytic transglycosylase MltG [bacterium]